MPLRAVIFDLDDTLYAMTGLHDTAMAAMRAYACKVFSLAPERFDRLFDTAKNQCMDEMAPNATSHSRLLWAQRFCENNGWNPFDHAQAMNDAYWNTFFAGMQPKPGMIDLLKHLKARGIRTALCTDMQLHTQYRKVAILGIGSLIDAMVCSDIAGQDKPAPVIYRQTLQKLRVAPDEAVMVGDNLKKDVFGPKNVGILGIWFNDLNRPETGVTAPIVHSHEELGRFLEALL